MYFVYNKHSEVFVVCLLEKECIMKNKHLSIDDRYEIQKGLHDNNSFKAIARTLNKSASTISREVYTRRIEFNNKCFNSRTQKCKFVNSCPYRGDSFCNKNCEKFELYICPRLSSAPYVCNGCKKWNHCRVLRYKYDAIKANNDYKVYLSDSRQGPDISYKELESLDLKLKEGLSKGHSVYQIVERETFPVSERTIYTYIELGYLPSVKNIDLPRKVKFKTRKKKNKREKNTIQRKGRTYTDFLEYIGNNPALMIVEMDTVIGKKEINEKCLLTLTWRNLNFLHSILLDEHIADDVVKAINKMQDTIGLEEFRRIFPVLLTDNGNEFLKVDQIENDINGNPRCRVFYCDPCASWQKGLCEQTHTFIRRIIPKGISMNNLTQGKINVMNSNINSTARKSLNNNTPYDLAALLLSKKIMLDFKTESIKKDKVILKPYLLKK